VRDFLDGALRSFDLALKTFNNTARKITEDYRKLSSSFEQKLKAMEAKEQSFCHVQERVTQHAAMAGQKIKLDIGGSIFSTTRTLLMSFENSFFTSMLSWPIGADGTYFVDRSATNFETMLRFMRTGYLDVVGKTPEQLSGLREEFDFYQIPAPSTIQRHGSLQGTLFRGWGVEGSLPGELDHPSDIAILTTGHLVVVDEGNQRIQVFNGAGALVRSWGRFARPFRTACSVAIYEELVYVVDKYNSCIQVFNAYGELQYSFGRNGTRPGQFTFPDSIYIDTTTKKLYVIDVDHTQTPRIQIFNTEGNLHKMVNMRPPMRVVHVVAVHSLMYAEIEKTGSVIPLSEEGVWSPAWLFSIASGSLCSAPDGTLVSCDYKLPLIRVCNEHGVILRAYPLITSKDIPKTLKSIVVDKNGSICMCMDDSRILQFY